MGRLRAYSGLTHVPRGWEALAMHRRLHPRGGRRVFRSRDPRALFVPQPAPHGRGRGQRTWPGRSRSALDLGGRTALEPHGAPGKGTRGRFAGDGRTGDEHEKRTREGDERAARRPSPQLIAARCAARHRARGRSLRRCLDQPALATRADGSLCALGLPPSCKESRPRAACSTHRSGVDRWQGAAGATTAARGP